MSWNPPKVCLQNLFVLFYMDRKMCKSRSQGYLETVIPVLFLNLKYFAEFCPSVLPPPPSFTVKYCLKNSSKYLMDVTTVKSFGAEAHVTLGLYRACGWVLRSCSWISGSFCLPAEGLLNAEALPSCKIRAKVVRRLFHHWQREGGILLYGRQSCCGVLVSCVVFF